MAARVETTSTQGEAPGLGRRLYHGWLELAAHFGEIQTLLIVCVVYVFVLGPMAVLATLTGRDLLAKRGFERVVRRGFDIAAGRRARQAALLELERTG